MSGIMESGKLANYDEVNELLDCVGSGYELSGLDEFDRSSLGVPGSVLLDFFQHHEQQRVYLEKLKRDLPDIPTGTERRVMCDIAERQKKGIAKYGVTVEGNPLSLRQWLQHAFEECLDQAVYLRRAIEEIDKGA